MLLQQIILGGEVFDQLILDCICMVFLDVCMIYIYVLIEVGVVYVVYDGKEGFLVEWFDKVLKGVELCIVDGFLQICIFNMMCGYVLRQDQFLFDDGWFLIVDFVVVEGDCV